MIDSLARSYVKQGYKSVLLLSIALLIVFFIADESFRYDDNYDSGIFYLIYAFLTVGLTFSWLASLGIVLAKNVLVRGLVILSLLLLVSGFAGTLFLILSGFLAIRFDPNAQFYANYNDEALSVVFNIANPLPFCAMLLLGGTLIGIVATTLYKPYRASWLFAFVSVLLPVAGWLYLSYKVQPLLSEEEDPDMLRHFVD